MIWLGVVVVQVVTKAWSGTLSSGLMGSVTVTWMTRWWLLLPKRLGPVAVTFTW